MTYRAIKVGARIKEVPIRFVDRELGTSKMSTYTVVEALGLVSWWGLKRVSTRPRGAKAAIASAPPPSYAVTSSGMGSGPGRSKAPIDIGEGPLVVLVHGQPGAGGDWIALATCFREITGCLPPTDRVGEPRTKTRSESSPTPKPFRTWSNLSA